MTVYRTTAALVLCVTLSTALAAGPRSNLVNATFSDDARILTDQAALAEFAGVLRDAAKAAGGSCAKSEYVAWKSQAGLEDTFNRGLKSLGYTYTLLDSSDQDGHADIFQLKQGTSALAGVWVETNGTTLLGWCNLKQAQAAPAKPPAALTPVAPAKPSAALTPAKPATPAKPTAPAKPVATVKAPTSKRGFVTGMVLDTQGRPLAGAEVYIVGTTFTQGQRTDFTVQSGADGSYSVRVPDGRYHASASIMRDLAGVSFKLPLHPESGSLKTEVDSSEGGNLSFRWRLSGKKPEGGNRSDDFYGASVDLSYCGLPAAAYCDARYKTVTPGAAPAGSTVTLTFTPQGKLVDGTAGQPVTYSFKTAPLSPPGGYPYTEPNGGGRTILGVDWPYHSQDFNDLPLGVYTLTATATLPSGGQVPLKLGLTEGDVENPSVTVRFASDDMLSFLKQLKVYIRD